MAAPIKKPLSLAQILKKADKDGYISAVITVDIDEINKGGYEEFLDLISRRLADSDVLQNISYRIVGYEGPGTIHLEVSGDASAIIEIQKGPKDWSPSPGE